MKTYCPVCGQEITAEQHEYSHFIEDPSQMSGVSEVHAQCCQQCCLGET